ncbi:uncharacterized protein G2W53_033284 [Senna tora]|uniref:Uncharacterized protein n=1 Tax=Senna tora TaxID=362788 RepID=A0A834SYZ0_9FABA|nr:uncharacterized protein G2W53_033284 [Senna tora]
MGKFIVKSAYQAISSSMSVNIEPQ